jgi:hypothetical protein
MRGTIRSVAAAVMVAALAVSVAGCSRASQPTIWSHEEAVAANDELFTVMNASIDATGGLQAWRMWSSNKPLDEHIREDNAIGGSECIPTDAWGLAGDPLGDFAGASLDSVGAVDAKDVLATVKKTWIDAGLTDITTRRTENGVIAVTAKHDEPSPTITFSYDGTSKKQKVAMDGTSICQSYDYLDDQPLDDEPS